MPLAYKETSAPAVEPVTLALARQQCVVDPGMTDDDNLIDSLIIASRQYVEHLMQRSIYERTMTLNMDFFPFPTWQGSIGANDRHVMYGRYWHQLAIRLPKPGTVSVESITYVDLGGTTRTLDPTTYSVDITSEPARIVPAPGTYWPYTQSYLPGSVQVNYTAGTYGDGVEIDTCPQTIKQAMLLYISYLYNHRDAAEYNPPTAIAMGMDALLAGAKFDSFGWES